MITEVSPLATVVLDSSGNGQCSLGPPSGTKWALRLATVALSSASPQPQAQFYRGSSTGPLELVDSTYTGASASSAKVGGALYYSGQRLWAKWIGGSPGATATLQAFGQQANRADPLAVSPLGEGFANPIVSQIIAGVPGAGPYTVINATPIPPELVAYYTAGSPATFIAPDTVLTVDLHYDGHGNYFYVAVVIDSSASPVTAVANGMNIAGTVTEIDRTTLNPSGGGSANLFFEHAKQTLHTGTGVDPTFVVLGASLGSDINADRFGLQAGGKHAWGPGGTNQAADSVLYRAAAGILAADDIRWNNAGAAETWHGMTLLNGWTNFGGTFVIAQYRRVAAPANCVQVVGVIAPGTKTDGTTIATLPAGYRPTNTIRFPVAQDGAVATNQRMDLDSAGNLKIQGVNLAGLAAVEFCEIIPLDA